MEMKAHGREWTRDNLVRLKSSGYISAKDCYADYAAWCRKHGRSRNTYLCFCFLLLGVGVSKKKSSCTFYDFSDVSV